MCQDIKTLLRYHQLSNIISQMVFLRIIDLKNFIIIIDLKNLPKKEDSGVGPIHHNSQLGIFRDPLPNTTKQPKGCIGMVSTPNCVQYYFSNKCKSYQCKQTPQKVKQVWVKKVEIKPQSKRSVNTVQTSSHTTNAVVLVIKLVQIFVFAYTKFKWVPKPTQVHRVIG